jgi:hypothetical protein
VVDCASAIQRNAREYIKRRSAVYTKRPPVLTSPWKIGFLVSLLLIFLSIGVNYIIFRTFNLSWSSVGFRQGSWFFHREEFVNEMLPLVAIIAIASLVAYFVITSAVRKYKAYLDSGHDYRRLISVIENSDDLDGENFARRLGKYPELRKFLISVRDQVRCKEKELKDWENKLKKRSTGEEQKEKFEKECRTLAEALPDLIQGEIDEDLHITSPGLTCIEDKLRSISEREHGEISGDVSGQVEEMVAELRNVGSDLRKHLGESSKELEASCTTAKELEEQLSALFNHLEDADESTSGLTENNDVQKLRQSLKSLQTQCEELSELGEETKSVAINTALRAGSGEGTVEDMIQLAEDVRKVALKFLNMSQSFGEIYECMHPVVGRIESELGNFQRQSGANAELVSSFGVLKNKMTLWVERIIVLNDHLKNAEETVDLSLIPIDEKLSAFNGELQRDPEAVQLEESGLHDESPVDKDLEQLTGKEFELETVDSCAFGDRDPIAFDLPDSDAESQEIPGIEKNPERIFSQPDETGEGRKAPVEEQAPADVQAGLDDKGGFEELPVEDESQNEPAASEASVKVDTLERTEETELNIIPSMQSHAASASQQKDYTAEKLEGQVTFDLTGSANENDEEIVDSVSMEEIETGPVEKTVTGEEVTTWEPNSKEAPGDVDVDENDEVIDLYSLGAVDIG